MRDLILPDSSAGVSESVHWLNFNFIYLVTCWLHPPFSFVSKISMFVGSIPNSWLLNLLLCLLLRFPMVTVVEFIMSNAHVMYLQSWVCSRNSAGKMRKNVLKQVMNRGNLLFGQVRFNPSSGAILHCLHRIIVNHDFCCFIWVCPINILYMSWNRLSWILKDGSMKLNPQSMLTQKPVSISSWLDHVIDMSVYHLKKSGESPDFWSIKWQFVSICNKEISWFAHWCSQISSISPLQKTPKFQRRFSDALRPLKKSRLQGLQNWDFTNKNVDLYNNQKLVI